MTTVNPDVDRPDWCPFDADEPCEIPVCVLLLPDCTRAVPDVVIPPGAST